MVLTGEAVSFFVISPVCIVYRCVACVMLVYLAKLAGIRIVVGIIGCDWFIRGGMLAVSEVVIA